MRVKVRVRARVRVRLRVRVRVRAGLGHTVASGSCPLRFAFLRYPSRSPCVANSVTWLGIG